MMINSEEGIPTKSNAYRKGEDIFYTQFNDIFFYIEDENQENFYYCVLHNLFPDIRIEKIFPLCGKDNVIAEAKHCLGDTKKVFVVDKDFDDFFSKIIIQPNLFYLNRYEIENHLIEEEAFLNYIVEERPKTKLESVQANINWSKLLFDVGYLLCELTLLHIVVQDKCPHIKNTSLAPEIFIEYKSCFTVKSVAMTNYRKIIQEELNKIDKRYKVGAQVKKTKEKIECYGIEAFITNIPGKYLMKFIKCFIEKKFRLASRDIESFNYRIAKNCSFESMGYLKSNITSYIK